MASTIRQKGYIFKFKFDTLGIFLIQEKGHIWLHTLNLEATEENLYDDLDDSSGNGGKRPAMKAHLEEDNKLQCSTTT